jgi:hypothetical protein
VAGYFERFRCRQGKMVGGSGTVGHSVNEVSNEN